MLMNVDAQEGTRPLWCQWNDEGNYLPSFDSRRVIGGPKTNSSFSRRTSTIKRKRRRIFITIDWRTWSASNGEEFRFNRWKIKLLRLGCFHFLLDDDRREEILIERKKMNITGRSVSRWIEFDQENPSDQRLIIFELLRNVAKDKSLDQVRSTVGGNKIHR